MRWVSPSVVQNSRPQGGSRLDDTRVLVAPLAAFCLALNQDCNGEKPLEAC
jgi:hypothetical protein